MSKGCLEEEQRLSVGGLAGEEGRWANYRGMSLQSRAVYILRAFATLLSLPIRDLRLACAVR